jgi:hypothetical protein
MQMESSQSSGAGRETRVTECLHIVFSDRGLNSLRHTAILASACHKFAPNLVRLSVLCAALAEFGPARLTDLRSELWLAGQNPQQMQWRKIATRSTCLASQVCDFPRLRTCHISSQKSWLFQHSQNVKTYASSVEGLTAAYDGVREPIRSVSSVPVCPLGVCVCTSERRLFNTIGTYYGAIS